MTTVAQVHSSTTVRSGPEIAAPATSGFRAMMALLSILLVALVVLFHVGFQASDDIQYVDAALGWLRRFPYVGDNHWALRHTVTLPTAAFIALFGLNSVSVSLTNIAYFAAFLGVNAVFLRRFLGAGAASIATLLLITMPGFVVVATYLNPDIPELFFVTTAFWLWYAAVEHDNLPWLWIAAGVAAGLAFVNRQTSAALLLFLALCFIVNPMARRSRYVLLGVAFAAVIGLEWLYVTTMTGDPLYRYRIDFNHDPVDRFAEAARVSSGGAWLDKEGNLSVNVFLDPILNLFVTQKYGVLFWLAVPAGVLALSRRSGRDRLLLSLVIALGVISFLFVALNPKLYLVPRYFVVVAWAATVAVAWWMTRLWARDRRRLSVAAICAAVAINIAALSVENTDPRVIEKSLVQWVAAQHGRTVYTDIETLQRSTYFFEFANVPMDAVSSDRPPVGALFFHSDARLKDCAAVMRCRNRIADFTPSPTWRVEETIVGPRRLAGRVAEALGVVRLLPPDIAKRLLAPSATMVIYRVQ